jgi:hypothetical protein
MNLVYGNKPRRLYMLVDPTDPAVRTHIGLKGTLEVLPTRPANTGYHNIMPVDPALETLLENFRQAEMPLYPSRGKGIFCFDRIDDAWSYSDVHPMRTARRILKFAETDGTYLLSLHDSTWIGILRSHRALPGDIVRLACDSYWRGETVAAKISQLGQYATRRPPVLEALFFGCLSFSNRQYDKGDISRPHGKRPLAATEEADQPPDA